MHVYCVSPKMLNGSTNKGHLVYGRYYIYIWTHKHNTYALPFPTHNIPGEEENLHKQFIATIVKEGPLTFLCNRSLPGVEKKQKERPISVKVYLEWLKNSLSF